MRALTAYQLKSFYNSFKGRVIRRIIREKILEIWPDLKAMNILGYGYALPYLKPYLDQSSCLSVMMPQQMGIHHWPPENKNLVCLSAEDTLPIETNSVDRILMVHSLEFLDNPEETFEELWRVLKSSGRLLIVVPNRVGLWARSDWSPFGQGQPYSARQVENFLSDNLFVHERTTHALFSPPFQSEFLLRAAQFFEKIGAYIYPALGGVHVIEASKQLYANTGTGVRAGHLRTSAKKAVPTKPVPTPRA